MTSIIHTGVFICAVLERQAFYGKFYVNFWLLRTVDKAGVYLISLWQRPGIIYIQSKDIGEISASLSQPVSAVPACLSVGVGMD